MKRYFVLLVILMAALSGCAKRADVEAERAALLQADADWATAVATKDPDAFASFFAPDAILMAPNLPVVNGMEGIRQWATANMSLPGFAVTWEATSAEVAASGDIGYTLGRFTFQMTLPDGTPLTDTGKYATIWKRQADGMWKVAVDIFNSEIPMVLPIASDTTGVQGQ